MLELFGHLPVAWLLFAVLAAAGFMAFFVGRTRAVAMAQGRTVQLNSQPNYHGYFVAMMTIAPAAILLALYVLFGESLVRGQLINEMPQRIQDLGSIELQQYIDRISEHAMRPDAAATGNALFDAASRRYTDLIGLSRIAAIFLSSTSVMENFDVRNRT